MIGGRDKHRYAPQPDRPANDLQGTFTPVAQFLAKPPPRAEKQPAPNGQQDDASDDTGGFGAQHDEKRIAVKR
ncbi:hypothetical protein AAHB37_08800 [Glutamicibacter halophytocola]|uniref:hypothetical protein n=1 Tax=Glutamicibacter halophytocola TaxID=1933880 RepID=UPI00321AC934